MRQRNIWCVCSLQSSIPLHTGRTHTHQILCCRITTLTFYIFNTNFKIGDFNKERTGSPNMVWMMVETCWGLFKCFNVNILD